MTLTLAHEVTPDLRALWNDLTQSLSTQRGGSELMDEIVMGNGVGLALDEVVGAGGLWIEQRDDELIGLMVMHERVVAAIFVIAAHRRQGIARSMIGFLATTPSAPLDGWALPGDRATKSFYESLGWKARLLTMRAD